jgi:hypothetical protein
MIVISNVWDLVSGIWCLASGVWYLVSGVWFLGTWVPRHMQKLALFPDGCSPLQGLGHMVRRYLGIATVCELFTAGTKGKLEEVMVIVVQQMRSG